MFYNVTTMTLFTDILEQIHVYIHATNVSQCDHNVYRHKTIRTDSRVHIYNTQTRLVLKSGMVAVKSVSQVNFINRNCLGIS